MYRLKDISVIIPTYNRPQDLTITLKKMDLQLKSLREVLVVDQSKNDLTRQACQRIRNKKIKYVFSDVPSITLARNLGFRKSSKDSKIIVYLDDDVDLDKEYFVKILEIFNTDKTIMGVAGYFDPPKFKRYENYLKHFFLLQNYEKNKARFRSVYGNTYPSLLDRTIRAEWLPGVNMAYKREVLEMQKFDEGLLGYTVAEDIDFTYRLNEKRPGSLVITPDAKIIHRASQDARMPSKKMAYINQVDHFYFFNKNYNRNWNQRIRFMWNLLGITLLRTLNLIKLDKNSFLAWKYYLMSLLYCVKNYRRIKPDRIREVRAF